MCTQYIIYATVDDVCTKVNHIPVTDVQQNEIHTSVTDMCTTMRYVHKYKMNTSII